MSWHARGSLYHLILQGERLGIARVAVDRARRNAEIHRVATLLGQLNERYHRLPRDERGEPAMVGGVLSIVEGTLVQCEEECQRLHALAAACQAMIDEARAAYRLPPAERSMRVASDFDAAPAPVGAPAAASPENGHDRRRPVIKAKG